MKYRADIDGLRAVAIVPVVFFHTGLGFSGGFVGVDIFFVISGYLLSRIVIQEMEENRFSFMRFYERRFRRLAPAFIAMLVATYLTFSFIMLPEDFEALGRSALAATFFYANFHYYNTIDYFSQSADLMPLLHMWSLAIEEQFYALLPLSVMITLWIFPRRWLPFLIGLALLCSFALCVYYTSSYRPFAFYMPHTRAWELLVGTLLAALPTLRCNERKANWLGSAALLAIALAVFVYDERAPFPGWLAGIPVLATAVLIYSGSASPRSWPVRFLALPPFVFIGKISYSLYLWHWPVIVFTKYADLSPDSLLTQMCCVAVSVGLAIISWALIEQPVRRRQAFVSLKAVYFGAIVSGSAMALIAVAIIQTGGFPNRVPDHLQTLLDFENIHDERCFIVDGNRTMDAQPCLRGDIDQMPSFFLIGDSHANALSPGLFAAAETERRSGLQFTGPGLFPGIGMRLVGSNRTDPRFERVLEMIAQRPEIKTVIVSASWADYALGRNWKGWSWLYQDDVSFATHSDENAAIVQRAIARLVEHLPNRHIILLDDVPAGIDLDINFFVRRSMLQSIDPKSAVLPHSEVVNRRTAYVPILAEIADKFDHVEFIPIFSGFCMDGNGCPLFSSDGNMMPMYADGDHLSEFGALTFTHAFQREIWR